MLNQILAESDFFDLSLPTILIICAVIIGAGIVLSLLISLIRRIGKKNNKNK